MLLQFVGAGSAFNLEQFQSNMILKSGEESNNGLLIDIGSLAPIALKNLGILGHNISDHIKGLYVSHCHSDHIGGIEWLGLNTLFNPNAPKPKLLAMPDVMEQLWENALKAGMETLEGSIASLSTFFDLVVLQPNEWFVWDGLQLMPVQTIHVVGGYKFMPSYGLMMGYGYPAERIFLTTDTQSNPNQLQAFYRQADTIFHDCETSPFKSGVHAHYDELIKLDAEVRAKMYLYHYNEGDLPDAKADGFRGFVTAGQKFNYEKKPGKSR